MTIINRSPAWSKSLAQPAKEFPLTHLSLISGTIPDRLRGTLYRNGPACLSKGGATVGHWFDGDGAVLGVNFTDAGATATYRYVKTSGYLEEKKADRFIYPNYGMVAAGGFWNNWLKPVKNAANTSVLALEDRLLALWEGGLPHSLDLEDLATRGLDNLKDSLSQPFSAHPKIDPNTGEIFNFGVTPGKNTNLNLYHCDRTGKVTQKNSVPLSGLPLIHDFVLAGKYLVFLISPVRINLFSVIWGRKSFSDAMNWQPELGTEILIFDRHNLELVSREASDPWYQWHYSNGSVDQEGNITIELVRYADFKTNQYLKEVAIGKTKTVAKGNLWQIKLDPNTGKVLSNEQLSNRSCEFPIVPQHQVSNSWRYTYLSLFQNEQNIQGEILNTIARFDNQTGNLSIAQMEDNCYACEPIYAPDPQQLDRGWILTVVYNGNNHTSEVRIYDSDHLEDEPVAILGLPNVIPPSFHGTWKELSR